MKKVAILKVTLQEEMTAIAFLKNYYDKIGPRNCSAKLTMDGCKCFGAFKKVPFKEKILQLHLWVLKFKIA